MLPPSMAPKPIFRFFSYDLFKPPYVLFSYAVLGKPGCMVKKKFNIKIVMTAFHFLNVKKDNCHIIF